MSYIVDNVVKAIDELYNACSSDDDLRGQGGLPWGQIMENELEYLVDRGGHGGHLAEKFLEKYCS